MTELLAPVGSREALVAAVEGGADAVYLAGKFFGARALAPNFTDEELAEAVRFVHLRGVLVYVTVNTLIDDSEIAALISYLRYLYQIGVDAIIVQDVGVASIARQVVPDMPVHASTQMTIHNLAGVDFLTKLGIKRVVLARELSLADIRQICSNTQTEIETFIHGALCISYSGQCLMSSMIGGRSGNRGRCAQPCRLPYTLVDKNGNDVLKDKEAGEYLLSPKDFNTLGLLPELIEAGVTSFKIEGRMKRAEYVAVVVDTYRRAIDAYIADKDNFSVSEQEQKDLAQIFNRDFTSAYLKGKPGRMMMSDRRPNNRGVRIGRVVNYNGQRKTAAIKLDEPLNRGDIIEFWVKVGGRVNVTVDSMTVDGQAADHVPAGKETVIAVQTPVRVNDRVFKVFDAGLMERARRFFNGAAAVRRIPVNVAVQVAEGQPLVITMRDSEGFCGQAATGFLAEKALKRPLTPEAVTKQIERLGTTVFELRHLECQIDGEVMVPVSEINDARRRAVEELEKARLSRFARAALSKPLFTAKDFLPEKAGKKGKAIIPQLVVNTDTVEKVQVALQNGADIIMFGGESFTHQPITPEEYRQVVHMTRKFSKKIIINTPRLVKEWQVAGLRSEIQLFRELAPDAVSVANLGIMHMARELLDIPLHGDYPLNVYNGAAVNFFAGQGIASLTLSPELNLSQVEQLAGRYAIGLECLVHGYLTLMVSEYCVVGSYLGQLHTGNCPNVCLHGEYWLKDRKNELFPVATDQFCRMHILNAKELSMLPHVPKFSCMGIERIRIEGKKSAPEYLGRITRLYREILDQGENHPLLAEDKLAVIEHKDITRGHYFRGVV